MWNEKKARFCREYVKDFNAQNAYIRAGYSDNGAGQAAHELLKNLEVKERIEELKAEIAVKEQLTPDWVLTKWKEIAAADPNELIELRVAPCAKCWSNRQTREMFEVIGYNVKRDPCSECDHCHGEGLVRVVAKPTGRLPRASKILYAGVKNTKDGVQILMRDQDAALKNIADYLGMFKIRSELSGPGGVPVVTATLTAAELTDDQLAAMIEGAGGA